MDIAGKKSFFVLGLGRSGRAAARLLAARGLSVVLYDDDEARVAEVSVSPQLRGGRTARLETARQELARCDAIVVSPGVSLDHELVRYAKDNAIEITGELDVAYALADVPKILGVTGTNGKSTVVSLVGRILETAGQRVAVAGNIGTPFADVVFQAEALDAAVIEVSSFQLDTIHEFKSDIAVLLNVTADHLDRYDDSLQEYARSKARILNRSGTDTYFVYNHEDRICKEIAAGFPGQKIPFSSSSTLDEGVFAKDGRITRCWRGEATDVLGVSEFSPVGLHNLENAMAAVAAVIPFDIDDDDIRESLRGYRPLPHRMEMVRVVDGVAYINDSKATNVDAAVKSVRSIDEGVVLILGGLDKNGDFEPLVAYLSRVKQIVAIGKARQKIASVLAPHCPVRDADSMEDAVAKARSAATAGDTVLLAPACASFDMFRNYEDRGKAFRDAVRRL